MLFTSCRYALPVSGGQRCGLEALPARGLCQEHDDEYLSTKSAYEKATKEAEAREILLLDILEALLDIASKMLVEKDSGGPEELREVGIMGGKYIERPQSAIRERKEAEKRFPLAGTPSHNWIRRSQALHITSEAARIYAYSRRNILPGTGEVLGGRPKYAGTIRRTDSEGLQGTIETARDPWKSRADDGGDVGG